ncbi:helix-turn-helix transcriptional regulator [Tardiphaga sp.]|uniref:helix-turn-helix domain-containing protein n=1 Tax=Tardiphaga sp. TaxID=1926292 RepID=UPI0026391851|nr:helix-turn-helix transcriptional regulator [Tardiphaga sp.]
MKLRDVLATNIRKRRRERGLSQEELAHRAGVDRTYISSLERSIYAASVDVVERLAKELEIDPADLFVRKSLSKPER